MPKCVKRAGLVGRALRVATSTPVRPSLWKPSLRSMSSPSHTAYMMTALEQRNHQLLRLAVRLCIVCYSLTEQKRDISPSQAGRASLRKTTRSQVGRRAQSEKKAAKGVSRVSWHPSAPTIGCCRQHESSDLVWLCSARTGGVSSRFSSLSNHDQNQHDVPDAKGTQSGPG